MEFKKQRIVVKVGTSTITHPSGAPNLRNIEMLARTLADLQDMGHEMILVSSGAIAVGTDKLGLAIPKMTQLFLELKRRGLPVETSVFTVEQAAASLRGLLRKGGTAC